MEKLFNSNFLNNLKREAENNPMLAVALGAAFITACSKFIDAAGHSAGSRAYARAVKHRTQKPPSF
jgi:hypothetical protein